jgi:uncharacterized phiE125 gp8 family phage protein
VWLPTEITTPPAVEPVTLAEAKEYLRVDDTSLDAQITIFIKSARAQLENETGSRLLTQTVLMRCSDWPDLDRLPGVPVQTVATVKYLDAAGIEQTLASTAYELFGAKLVWGLRPTLNTTFPSIRLASDAIRISAVIGYGAATSNLPDVIRLASLLLIRGMLDNEPADISSVIVNDRVWL